MSDTNMGGDTDDMDMGSMSMGPGIPDLFYLQKMFWAVIGAAIALATLVNMYNKLLLRQRYALAQNARGYQKQRNGQGQTWAYCWTSSGLGISFFLIFTRKW